MRSSAHKQETNGGDVHISVGKDAVTVQFFPRITTVLFDFSWN